MKRKGWWIAGGIILLWLSPIFWGVGSFLYRKHQKADYDRRAEAFRVKLEEKLKVTITDEDRARWKERERLEKIAEEAERDRKRNEYLASPVQPPMRPSNCLLEDEEDKPKTKTVYVYTRPDPYYEPIQQKPDLTGVYWTQPLKAGQGAWQNVQINYVSGPY